MLNEMASSSPRNTGLPTKIWIGEVGGHHGPRIKVSNNIKMQRGNDCFVVSISNQPRVITGVVKLTKSEVQDIFDWIILNYDHLMLIYKALEIGNNVVIDNKQYHPYYVFTNILRKLK